MRWMATTTRDQQRWNQNRTSLPFLRVRPFFLFPTIIVPSPSSQVRYLNNLNDKTLAPWEMRRVPFVLLVQNKEIYSTPNLLAVEALVELIWVLTFCGGSCGPALATYPHKNPTPNLGRHWNGTGWDGTGQRIHLHSGAKVYSSGPAVIVTGGLRMLCGFCAD